jgi:mersacidin/lichenicidin family type 2 lantibiotic
MKTIDMARALKDAEYRATLSAAELAQLPENAAGIVALSDEDLAAVSGGALSITTGKWFGGVYVDGGCGH